MMQATVRLCRVHQRWIAVCSALLVLLPLPGLGAETDAEFFESKIRPLLAQRCYACHSAEKGKTEGGLALDSQPGWRQGGDSGAAIVPGNVEASLLIRAVQYRDDGPQMPPEEAGGKLPETEISLLIEWVRRGAADPRLAAARRGGLSDEELRQWWSFQPLQRFAPPPVGSAASVGNGIDRFLLNKLEAEGLTFSPPADRRTLIRRAAYDLTGLPPAPEDVEAFLTDHSARAYESLIDRLLESPHYGERWGRHWLDLVRYADTAGENTDHPIQDAWRYRNWVIDSFNGDLAYDDFVREQVAGDLLHAHDQGDAYAAGVISTGFLAIARRFDHDSDKHMHLTYEDTIDALGKTFLGLSIACARCHDHKYDPISAKDYYALYGILNSTQFAFPGCEAKQQPRDLVPLLPPAEWARIIEPYERQLEVIDAELKQLDSVLATQAAALKTAAGSSLETLARGKIADGGAESFEAGSSEPSLSLAVNVGEIIQLTVNPDENYGADTTLIEWDIAEVDGEQRCWSLTDDATGDFLAANPHADRYGNAAVWLYLDARQGLSLLPEAVHNLSGKPGLHVWRNGDNPAVLVNSTDQPISVWTALPPRSVFVHPAPDGPVAIAWVSPVQGRVQMRGRIADAHPGGPTGVGWSIERRGGDHAAALQTMAKSSNQRMHLLAQRAALASRAPVRSFAYAVTEGTVGNARLHLRGDPEKLGEEVPRRWLELFGGDKVPAGAGSGRWQLAQWLTDPENPLTARVMVNRIWQHHFGQGLVQTPNDFGTRGQPPTHPELLDWLAVKFIEFGWSVKAMHRLIMMSAAYRQSAGDASSTMARYARSSDPNNQLCWRFDRRRMSAEELRDSLLVASQHIDLRPGGSHPIPPTGAWSFTQHVPFAGVAETNERSIYLMTLRNRRHPFMGLFDGADPNASTPERQVTTVPTQSLYFLNDAFFHEQAEKVARRILTWPSDSSRLDELFRIVLQRSPTSKDSEAAAVFLEAYAAELTTTPSSEQPLMAWSAYARVLLSSNEFLYLD